MRLLYQFPMWLQRCYGNVVWRQEEAASKVAFLTFDDGPVEPVTSEILDILVKYGAKVTFFCVGDNIRKYPATAKRIIDEGHVIGNHTCHHLAGWQTPTDCYLADVAEADSLMREIGAETGLFRPPYGRMRLSQKAAIAKTHKIVMWDVLTHDYNPNFTPDRIVKAVQRYTRNGSIINFHDSLKSHDNVIAALPRCIDFLLANGYQLKTL